MTPRFAQRAAALAATFTFTGAASALPMGFEGSSMLMLDTTPEARSLGLNHAVTGTWAPGVTLRRWNEPVAHGAKLVRESAGLSLTHRLHRWNLPHAQSNLWLVLDAGTLRAQGGHGRPPDRGGYGAFAALADYETTRFYAGASAQWLRGPGSLQRDTQRVRSGFSFWEAEYEGTQPWLIVEAERKRDSPGSMREGTLVTPMLRLIHRRYFVEIGVNREGGMFNLMFNH